ncbi:hypothetical protein GPECTOR_60g696 [Gonium pectorale]|uniref:Guanylate cyclase domain-containing protein n=1 Tax=Gonium pectorale TaxID=33097 RepID=A0A150G4W1_GONPE|nr:hypothetical protein GPECTOR_60g696 [Gonium pectorale]|eukprot:KXZ44919.1 hypothetical protein GPECTOR_60g696 [Gonium pectorale]
MESTGVPGLIHASETAQALLRREAWVPTGGIEVKGKGIMRTYLWAPPDSDLSPEATAALARYTAGSATAGSTDPPLWRAAAASIAAAASASAAGLGLGPASVSDASGGGSRLRTAGQSSPAGCPPLPRQQPGGAASGGLGMGMGMGIGMGIGVGGRPGSSASTGGTGGTGHTSGVGRSGTSLAMTTRESNTVASRADSCQMLARLLLDTGN